MVNPLRLRKFSVSPAPFLLLATPFAVFLNHHDYQSTRPETLMCWAVLAACSAPLGWVVARAPRQGVVLLSGTIVLVIDLQFDALSSLKLLGAIFLATCAALWMIRANAANLLALMAATMLALTLVTPSQGPAARGAHDESGSDRLPLMVHFVFDEHIGIEGIPRDAGMGSLVTELKAFYSRHGFFVAGGAYSEYSATARSLAHLVNFSSGGPVEGLYQTGSNGFTWELTRNRYFDDLRRRGYRLRVFQTDHIDLCAGTASVSGCERYRSNSIAVLKTAPIAASGKACVIAGVYMKRSQIYGRAREIYRSVRARAENSWKWMPVWDWDRDRVGPLAVMPVARQLETVLRSARRGDFVFAHLLIPHYPYILDAECNVTPPAEWLDSATPDASPQMTNTVEGRQVRYRKYALQLRCMYKTLDQVLNALPEEIRHDAIIIVQGDHGSRLTLTNPSSSRVSHEAPSDYVDAFSTLFAVRSPDIAPGYNDRPAPVTCLLKAFAEHDYRTLALPDVCSNDPVVFIPRTGGKLSPQRFPSHQFAH